MMRDIFDIIPNKPLNKEIKINACCLRDQDKEELEALYKKIKTELVHNPEEIKGKIDRVGSGFFSLRYIMEVKMTEDVYDYLYSIHGAIIENLHDNVYFPFDELENNQDEDGDFFAGSFGRPVSIQDETSLFRRTLRQLDEETRPVSYGDLTRREAIDALDLFFNPNRRSGGPF